MLAQSSEVLLTLGSCSSALLWDLSSSDYSLLWFFISSTMEADINSQLLALSLVDHTELQLVEMLRLLSIKQFKNIMLKKYNK